MDRRSGRRIRDACLLKRLLPLLPVCRHLNEIKSSSVAVEARASCLVAHRKIKANSENEDREADDGGRNVDPQQQQQCVTQRETCESDPRLSHSLSVRSSLCLPHVSRLLSNCSLYDSHIGCRGSFVLLRRLVTPVAAHPLYSQAQAVDTKC